MELQEIRECLNDILTEIREIKKWQAKVDRGIEGEPTHGHPSYADRMKSIENDMTRTRKIAYQAHNRIDKIMYVAVGASSVAGTLGAFLFKLITGS